MNIPEVIKLADDLVFSQTGDHLNYLQEAIIKGTLQHKNYTQIAKEINSSESHVKNTGAELWQLLSSALGEHITKKNFKNIFYKAKIYNNYNSNIGKDNLKVNNLNFCSERDSTKVQLPTENEEYCTETTQLSPQLLDLSYAPDIFNFYGRTSELSILKKAILDEKIRLVTVYGLSEVGKSTFIRYLITQIKENFDYIIWRNLTESSHIQKLTNDFKQFFLYSENPPYSQILDYLINYRCLLILDDLQNLFKTNELAGEYLPEYQDYINFFQQVVTSSHQSCLITISWEKPRHLSSLENKNYPLTTLQLKGFENNNTEILKHNDLQDEDKWSDLMSLYQGHPAWLNIIAEVIKDLFNGSVTQFLSYNQELLFLGDIELILKRQLERLSPLENKLVLFMANSTELLGISNPPEEIELSKVDFLMTVQSLERRCLLEKIEQNGRKKFKSNRIFKHYCLHKQ